MDGGKGQGKGAAETGGGAEAVSFEGFTNRPIPPEAAAKLQAMDLQDKYLTTIEKIDEWEMATGGAWYVSFSGGKDSTVLTYIAAKYLASYRTPPHPLHLLFCDTGLEYPEIRQFAMSFPEFLQKRFPTVTVDFQRRRPKRHFFDVIHDYGYPIIGKEIAQQICESRKCPGGAMDKILRGTHETKPASSFYTPGVESKWLFLQSAPFLISHLCCKYTKKEPADRYASETKRFSVNAQMAEESALRATAWMKTGCNAFDGKRPQSKPMSFWRNQDVLNYILQEQIPICSVYGEIMAFDGENYYPKTLCDAPLKCTGCQRTGCVFCAFGAHLEKGDDRRFIRLRETHPNHWRFAIEGGEWDAADGMWKPSKTPGHVGLGMGRVLDYIGVEYK